MHGMCVAASALVVAMLPHLQTPKSDFTFLGKPYFHRFTKGEMQEFTPQGQTDLMRFTEMFTVNRYPTVKDGEALAKSANTVLEAYKANKGVVVRTHSVPRTSSKPAEHLVVVLFPRPEFIEASFTRFMLSGGVGYAVTFSHRKYGKDVGTVMSEWLKGNGDKTEKALMAMPKVPKKG